MASINGVRGSGAGPSIFGNRNVISGLASGMDTEGMIENAVSGYKTKITQLQQQRQRVEWKQNAYRDIIQKMVNFSQKYATLASGSDLINGSFFDNAINVLANGANADKVSASGKASTSVQVDSITQLATSSSYSTTGALRASNTASGSFDVKATEDVGKLDGTLTLGYGNQKIQISFTDKDVYKDADSMAAAINEKLANQTITLSDGREVKASEGIEARNVGGEIRFSAKNAGDSKEIWIDSASQSIDTALGINTTGDGKDIKSFTFKQDQVMEQKPVVDILSEKGFTITYNGETKTVKGPTSAELGSNWSKADYISKLQEKINSAFGPNSLTVSDAKGDGSNEIQFKFTAVDPHGRFEVHSAIEDKIGMQGGVGSALNTSSTLGDLLKGNEPASYDFKIKDAAGNEKTIATFNKDTTLQEVIDTINNSADSNIKVSYSKFTGKFMFESKETGENTNFDFGTGLASQMFGNTNASDSNGPSAGYQAGQNAEFTVTVNNEQQTIRQSSNTINIDGLKLTMKGTFGAAGSSNEAVTFTTSTDADKIVNAVKSMVEDYNAMAEEIKKTYASMPLTNSRGDYYEPLTDEDRADMSESAIKAYEEKAKTGLLFADRELATLYDGMTKALGVLGATGKDAQNLGLTVSYKDGASTLVFDENQFRKALEDDPKKVKEVFVGSQEAGNKKVGLMEGLKTQLDKYSKTTGAMKGVLVQKAGSPLAPTTMYQNVWQKEVDNFEKKISSLQDKMSSQIDYYNRQFSALEQMILQMNNQSSMLMGFNGGF